MAVKYPSTTTWAQAAEWLHNLEDDGFRVRVVMAREGSEKMRVSVTASVRGPEGRWAEAYRRGEVVASRNPDAAQKAVIRACAGILADAERLDDEARQEGAPWAQLPLPGM